jgi:hypothetical protein
MFLNDLSDLFNRKQDAGFIIGKHDGNDAGIAAQGFAKIVQIEFSGFIHLQPGHFTSDFREMFAKVAYGFVLNARGNDMTARRVLFEKAADGPVV